MVDLIGFIEVSDDLGYAMRNFGRYRLSGDEDCGVGVECNDCFDGGRPLAYYEGVATLYLDDPKVANVSTIPDLLLAAVNHERTAHQAENTQRGRDWCIDRATR